MLLKLQKNKQSFSTNKQSFSANRKLRIFLVLLILFNTIGIFVSPENVSATNASAISDSMTRQEISIASSHTIIYTMGAQTFAAGETITIDFNEDGAAAFSVDGASSVVGDFDVTIEKSSSPQELVVRAVSSDGSPDCTGFTNPHDVSIDVEDATGIVRILACGSFTASDSGADVTIEYGTAATDNGTGANRVTNPGTAGSKEINITSNGGDDAFALDVPIMDSDQVTVTASVDTTTTFDIDIADGTAGDSNAPYQLSLGELVPSAATNESTSGVSEIYLQLASNAGGGVIVYVKGNTGTLSSSSTSDSIDSTDDSDGIETSSANGEWGLAAVQDAAPTEGTLDPLDDYDVYSTGNAVGEVTTAFQQIFDTNTDPISNVYGEVAVRAVAGTTTAAASDYTETLTFIATATY